MDTIRLSAKANQFLHRLCHDYPHRRLGSPGNRAATELFAAAMADLGYKPIRQEFSCLDWRQEGATLSSGDESFEVEDLPKRNHESQDHGQT